MKWETVESSNILTYLYDKEKQTLDIIFSSGSQYRYIDVSIQRMNKFKNAESKGSYFAKKIRPNYKTKRIV